MVEAGASVAGIMMGSPSLVAGFCQEREAPFRCLADPDRSAYKAFSLPTAGPAKWMGAGMGIKALKLFRKGIAIGLPSEGQDVRQMPGTFVMARGGRIRLAHYNSDASDNPEIDVILGALGAA
jgi:peroxiredoxin